jgi:hypothetical protein
LRELAIVLAVALVASGALYIRLRWRRSPQAYRAMLVIAACYFVAGSIIGAWVLHLASPRPTVPSTQIAAPSAVASPLAVAPTLKENYTGPSFPIPLLHYDPAHAILQPSPSADTIRPSTRWSRMMSKPAANMTPAMIWSIQNALLS